MRNGLLQGWDLALAVLQSYRDALPQASAPTAANDKAFCTMSHEDDLPLSAFSLTAHLVVVDIIVTSHRGTVFCVHPEGCLWPPKDLLFSQRHCLSHAKCCLRHIVGKSCLNLWLLFGRAQNSRPCCLAY